MLRKIASGISAGLLITVGGSVFLACENRYVGAVMFSVALLCICYMGYSLYTGKIGFIPEKHGKEEVSVLLLGLFGNAIGAIAGGYAIRYAIASLGDTAEKICTSKLAQTLPQTFIRALFCGILMYLAVSVWKNYKSVIGIFFCIPVFILSGFEHSIADIFYFAASGIVSGKAFLFIVMAILGNTVGAMILPFLSFSRKDEK